MSACRGETYADKRGGGGQKSENFTDIICERSLNAKSKIKTNGKQHVITHK